MESKDFLRILNEDDLIRRCLQLCQIVDAPGKYATTGEEDFIIATIKVQRDLNTRRLFTPRVLEEYKKYGFTRSNVNTKSNNIAKKFLAKRDRGEIFLLPFLEKVRGNDFEVTMRFQLEQQ